MMKRLHVAGLVALLISVAGLLTSPDVLNLLPAKYSDTALAIGLLLQAITKGVQHGNTVLVDKSPTT
jgi:hypothetical protein